MNLKGGLVLQIKEGSIEAAELPNGNIKISAKIYGPREDICIYLTKVDVGDLLYHFQLDRIIEVPNGV